MFQIDVTSRTPIFEQLMQNIISLTAAGVLKPGDKLPSVRTLATQLGINPNTVAKAYRELERRNCLYTTAGVGSFVGESAEQGPPLCRDLREFCRACVRAKNSGFTEEELKKEIERIFKGGALND